MKVWIRYTVWGRVGSPAYKDEVAFRVGILGDRHWSGMSMNGDKRDITLQEEEDIALLFTLKYASCRLDKVDESAT